MTRIYSILLELVWIAVGFIVAALIRPLWMRMWNTGRALFAR